MEPVVHDRTRRSFPLFRAPLNEMTSSPSIKICPTFKPVYRFLGKARPDRVKVIKQLTRVPQLEPVSFADGWGASVNIPTLLIASAISVAFFAAEYRWFYQPDMIQPEVAFD